MGWRREWRAVPAHQGASVCALSIRPAPGCAIDGVLVVEPTRKLPALDQREAIYDRLYLARRAFQMLRSDPLAGALQTALLVYRAKRGNRVWGSARAPICHSYVDAVMKGYLDSFGPAGLRRFMATTDGFDWVPILRDRKEPLYPRAIQTTPAERDCFDALLADAGARWIDARG